MVMIHEEPPDNEVELVQLETWARLRSAASTVTPIFLIHDGGGTTFAYHCLDPLRRFVYGIRNPHFFTGATFANGISEMGRLYANMIRRAVAQADFPAKRASDGRTNVFLGGWSLGGMLSLEVAHVLAEDEVVRVIGILMVDSPYPGLTEPFDGPIAPRSRKGEAKSKNEVLADRCMAEARRMVDGWQLPVWKEARRPPTVLLRATDRVPTLGPGVERVDVYRSDAMLEWARYDEAMFEEVLEVRGHHFDLFSPERISATTEVIRRGLEVLDGCVPVLGDACI
ncbi:hypothetical protein CDD81_6226 [Ophiocordyceps australis]|uniref:AB hydrolase-1 domain-containing protein n=1 Tax=Ophiocordyceps australis TaxID=1399860 RepID=A0A2C5Y102_9HYPO|nr:hypothetical protein CDD81_6226 [Ophiocordyceps australis]